VIASGTTPSCRPDRARGGVEVAERNEATLGQQALVGTAVLRLSDDRERAERAAVEGLRGRHELRLRGGAVRQLERALH